MCQQAASPTFQVEMPTYAEPDLPGEHGRRK